jgi:Sigma-54, DNA binding domain
MAEEEQEESWRFPNDSVPEDDDDESWEPEEEEYLSDDWDPPQSRDNPGNEEFESPELDPVEDAAESSQAMIPAILVDCEQTPTGPELVVSLANHGTLLSLLQAWRRYGDGDRASALAYRLTKLLELSRYVVEQQRDFFLRQGPRRPLTAVQVATTLWPKENWRSKKSAMSRLISGKGIRTPWDEIIELEALLPSNADCMLEHICAILRTHDRVERRDGKIMVEEILPVDSLTGNSIVHELQRRWQQWLGTTDGLSAENVKHVMKRHNIPRIAGERRTAYEQGTAWWMVTP